MLRLPKEHMEKYGAAGRYIHPDHLEPLQPLLPGHPPPYPMPIPPPYEPRAPPPPPPLPREPYYGVGMPRYPPPQPPYYPPARPY